MARDNGNHGRIEEQARVYAPANGTLAYKRDDYAYRTARLSAQPRRREAEPAVRPDRKRRRQPAERPNLLHMIRENRFFLKLTAIICLIMVAGVASFAVIRFFDIAAIQAEINTLNSNIEAEQRMIKSLSSSDSPILNATEFAQRVGLVPARTY